MRSTNLTFPFKGIARNGDGAAFVQVMTHSHLSPPLEGEEVKCVAQLASRNNGKD